MNFPRVFSPKGQRSQNLWLPCSHWACTPCCNRRCSNEQSCPGAGAAGRHSHHLYYEPSKTKVALKKNKGAETTISGPAAAEPAGWAQQLNQPAQQLNRHRASRGAPYGSTGGNRSGLLQRAHARPPWAHKVLPARLRRGVRAAPRPRRAIQSSSSAGTRGTGHLARSCRCGGDDPTHALPPRRHAHYLWRPACDNLQQTRLCV
jgi:hypothetical protein